ncbi:MAG: hypothetical protein FWD17_10255 [Polyangiaceae bacterium]|nr:hypothetical protein [Polyangiaceae bacterium]
MVTECKDAIGQGGADGDVDALIAWGQRRDRERLRDVSGRYDELRHAIDLLKYVTGLGYEVQPPDGVRLWGARVAVLRHFVSGDQIVVCECDDGGPDSYRWYVRIADYGDVGAEDREVQVKRLQECIFRSNDRGDIVDFIRSVSRCDGSVR